MQKVKIIHLESVGSTNSYLSARRAEADGGLLVAECDYQTAGRGQGTNRWESERGKNLVFSILAGGLDVKAADNFILSEAIALAIAQTLEQYAGGISVKWPNDIYCHDGKICGILIENTLVRGAVKSCIMGCGVNVNQTVFTSDAPNPVSLKGVTGSEHDRYRLLDDIVRRLSGFLDDIALSREEGIRRQYACRLYRRTGQWRFKDNDGCFTASVTRVCGDGTLVLTDTAGRERRYAFKEVAFMDIPPVG